MSFRERTFLTGSGWASFAKAGRLSSPSRKEHLLEGRSSLLFSHLGSLPTTQPLFTAHRTPQCVAPFITICTWKMAPQLKLNHIIACERACLVCWHVSARFAFRVCVCVSQPHPNCFKCSVPNWIMPELITVPRITHTYDTFSQHVRNEMTAYSLDVNKWN